MLIRYSDDVGTEYSLTKSSGRTLTREIVAKSNEDDFPYGFSFQSVNYTDTLWEGFFCPTQNLRNTGSLTPASPMCFRPTLRPRFP